MNIQWISVIIIVASAVIIMLVKLTRYFFLKKNDESICNGCSGCSLRNELKIRQKECSGNVELKNKYSKK